VCVCGTSTASPSYQAEVCGEVFPSHVRHIIRSLTSATASLQRRRGVVEACLGLEHFGCIHAGDLNIYERMCMPRSVILFRGHSRSLVREPQYWKDRIGEGGARRAQAQGSAPGRPTPRRASEATTLHPPCLPVRYVGRDTAVGAILGHPTLEIARHSKMKCSTPPRRRGVAAVGGAAVETCKHNLV